MKILVTGINGFMGTNFAAMAAQEHQVYGLYLPGTPTSQCEPFVQQLLPVDIRDREAVLRAFDTIKPDAVLHLAALVTDTGPTKNFLDINVLGLENCLDGARAAGTRRFVSMSTLAIHGPGPFRGNDENTPATADYPDYAVSKIMGEHLITEYSQTGMETVIIRPGLIPFGRFDRLFSLQFVRLMQRGIVPMVNGGQARINTAYVDNLVHGLLLAIAHPAAANQVFILADPPVTFRELAKKFSAALGKRAIPIPIPSGPMVAAGRVMESLPLPFAPPITRYRARVVATDFWFSTKKAEKTLGYKPIVSLDDAVKRTVEWAVSL